MVIFHYYTIITDLRLPIAFCLSSGDIYLSLCICLSFSLVTFSELFCFEYFETFVNFLIFHFYIIILIFLKQFVTHLLFSMIKKFLAIFTTQVFAYIFTNIFTHIFSKRQKSIPFYKYSISRFGWIFTHFFYFTL